METYRDGVACHRDLAKVKAELARARETENEYYRNAISSFVASVKAEGKLTRERDAALATIARVEKVCDDAEAYGDEIDTLEVRAALAEPAE